MLLIGTYIPFDAFIINLCNAKFGRFLIWKISENLPNHHLSKVTICRNLVASNARKCRFNNETLC